MCSENPKYSEKYINYLHFAYRKTPQGSTAFLPFELLYWRSVRGLMAI